MAMMTGLPCAPVTTETLAMFEDNMDILAHFELVSMPGLLLPDDILNLDPDISDVNGAESFNRLFDSCLDRMASYTSVQAVSAQPPALDVSSSPEAMEIPSAEVSSGTFLAPPPSAKVDTEDFWKKPDTFDCSHCSKILSRSFWRRHHVSHVNGRLKCKRCGYIAISYSGIRRHNEYYHGAKMKRHVFFDSC